MTIGSYLTYLVAVAAFFATPPDTSQLLIISNSIAHGLRRSFNTIAGDLTANALQILAAAFGLAAVIASSSSAFVWVKWLGVAYLVWIGVQVSRSVGIDVGGGGCARAGASGRLFRQGFFTSLSNPYAIVFFGALFPQFIEPGEPVVPQVMILGVTYLIVDGVMLLVWGWLAVRAAERLRRLSSRLIARACGLIMISAAILLATKKVSAV